MTAESVRNKKHNKKNTEAHGPVHTYLKKLIQFTTKSF